jgi:hypothetical protein
VRLKWITRVPPFGTLVPPFGTWVVSSHVCTVCMQVEAVEPSIFLQITAPHCRQVARSHTHLPFSELAPAGCPGTTTLVKIAESMTVLWSVWWMHVASSLQRVCSALDSLDPHLLSYLQGPRSSSFASPNDLVIRQCAVSGALDGSAHFWTVCTCLPLRS